MHPAPRFTPGRFIEPIDVHSDFRSRKAGEHVNPAYRLDH